MEQHLYQLQRHLPEQLHLDNLIRLGERHLRVTEVLTVPQGDMRLPVRVIEMGSQAAGAPALHWQLPNSVRSTQDSTLSRTAPE